MKIALRRPSSTLAWRVTSTILIFSSVLIFLVGSALNSRLSSGIFNEKLNVSLADAGSTTRSVELQLEIAQYQNTSTVAQILSNILSVPSLTGTTPGREVALFALPQNRQAVAKYQGTSNLLDPRSIPVSLRAMEEKKSGTYWVQGAMRYYGGRTEPALIVANTLAIPGAGKYEFYVLFSLTQQESTLSLIRSSLWLTGLALTILIGLITWLVIRRISRPIREAATIAQQLTAGDLEQRMNVVGRNEVATLGVAFNEMAVSLKQQISRLENLSNLQQRFVSDVSHELRTPLTTMKMASQVIYTARDKFDPVVARSAELLAAQIERFEALLSDLLEVSRFDAEAASVEIKNFDFVELVRKTIDYVHPSQEQFIKLKTQEPEILIDADPRRIERILRNLITNAIDHREEKDIDITIVASENEVAVAVRDYGIGFTERDNKFLFDRFWRADPSRARTRGGTGLGLSIALEDAKLHQGTLQAWGRPQQGAQFVLTLPKRFGSSIQSFPIPVIPTLNSSTLFTMTEDDAL